jgi:4-hydroxy-3-polyprenylbenzoate decarboxylase
LDRLIIAITGASGAAYGVCALQALRDHGGIETDLILSPAGARTIAEETDHSVAEVKSLASVAHPYKDIGASLASGSYRTLGMLVAPCSIKTLSGIANSYADNLIVRAADVCFKERRRVVLLLRETPLHRGHIELMLRANDLGAVVMPPVPAFYHRPTTVDDIVKQTVGRAFDLFGIDIGSVKRWTEPAEAGAVVGDALRRGES